MATRSTAPKTTISVTLKRGAEKVNSVVYAGDTTEGERMSFYIPRSVLNALGNPATLVTTFTAA